MFTALRLLTISATILSGAAAHDLPAAAVDLPATAPQGRVSVDRDAHVYDALVDADPVARPHLLDDDVGDIIVSIGGGARCTGTPITGTRFVVTAAHCVLDANGAVDGGQTVARDGVEYTPVSVLVDPGYHSSPSARLDAAVLVMEESIPGPAASLGVEFPTAGVVTIAGYQTLDTDGSLLRGTTLDDRPRPQGSNGGLVVLERAPAGCVVPASKAIVSDARVKVPCGLIPGASGGGAYTHIGGKITLVGIISTVSHDLTSNGLVPMPALLELLDHPAQYTHEMTSVASASAAVPLARW